MLFGFANAPATFQKLTNKAVDAPKYQMALVLLDKVSLLIWFQHLHDAPARRTGNHELRQPIKHWDYGQMPRSGRWKLHNAPSKVLAPSWRQCTLLDYSGRNHIGHIQMAVRYSPCNAIVKRTIQAVTKRLSFRYRRTQLTPVVAALDSVFAQYIRKRKPGEDTIRVILSLLDCTGRGVFRL